ncbi:hypothetical protein HYR99_13405 [Candidatus Poribacteria bacterium]|nr:hypothetical protein [Candidatus Poribacteria bacterium]
MNRLMKRSILFVLSLLVIGLMVSLQGTLLATATETPVSGSGTVNLTPIDPGESWDDDEGVRHVRNRVLKGTITGDIEGEFTLVLNANISLTTGNGDSHGTITIVTADGTWEGSFSGVFVKNLHSAEFVCQGSGGLDGMKLHLTSQQFVPCVVPGSNCFNYEGSILDPHGE